MILFPFELDHTNCVYVPVRDCLNVVQAFSIVVPGDCPLVNVCENVAPVLVEVETDGVIDTLGVILGVTEGVLVTLGVTLGVILGVTLGVTDGVLLALGVTVMLGVRLGVIEGVATGALLSN